MARSSNKGRRFPPEVLTRAEAHALVEACGRSRTGLRNKALVSIMWRAGLRVSEALALEPSDVSVVRGTVRVRNGKGGRHRTVGLPTDAIDAVECWKAVRPDVPDAPLLCTLKGEPVKASYVRALLPRLAKRAGVKRRVNPHSLRHTMAAELMEEGQPLPIIQAQLGHANLNGTAHYLGRIAPTDLQRVARERPAPDIAEMAPKVSEVERLRREVAELRSKLEAETPR